MYFNKPYYLPLRKWRWALWVQRARMSSHVQTHRKRRRPSGKRGLSGPAGAGLEVPVPPQHPITSHPFLFLPRLPHQEPLATVVTHYTVG